MTVQEAMASGLPVVLCDDPATDATSTEPARVFGSPHRTPARSSTHSSPSPGHEDTRQAAARAAETHAKRAFSSSKAADDHEALYDRIRAERGT